MIPIVEAGLSIIDKIIPDPAQRDKAKQDLMVLQQNGELKELEVTMSAIIMEAQSDDPWTSRARPAFLYVMYLMILFSIPMGFLFAFYPAVSESVISGVKGWLEAIPPELYALFGAGYLGYANNRTKDKAIKAGVEVKQGLFSRIMG